MFHDIKIYLFLETYVMWHVSLQWRHRVENLIVGNFEYLWYPNFNMWTYLPENLYFKCNKGCRDFCPQWRHQVKKSFLVQYFDIWTLLIWKTIHGTYFHVTKKCIKFSSSSSIASLHSMQFVGLWLRASACNFVANNDKSPSLEHRIDPSYHLIKTSCPMVVYDYKKSLLLCHSI